MVVFDKKMWIIGGFGAIWENSVYNSTNGTTWTVVRANGATGGFDGRHRHTTVVFDEKMWIIGGNNPIVGSRTNEGAHLNDVWNSTNGVTWNKVRANSAAGGFHGRFRHTSVVFDEKMWVIGGNGLLFYNDVWSSTDGKDWTLETDNAGFSDRQSHQSVVFDNKMWVIAGDINISGNVSNKDDVWSSTNGINWVESTATVRFSARKQHTSVVFNDGKSEKIWVIGGSDDDGITNDVWSISKD